MTSFVIVQEHFENKRSLATGISRMGTSIGTLLYAPIFRMMVSETGWRQAMTWSAAISLQAVVCGALFITYKESVIAHQGQSATVATGEILMSKTTHSKLISGTFILFLFGAVLILTGPSVMHLYSPRRAIVNGISKIESSLLITSFATMSTASRIVISVIGDREWVNRNLVLSLSVIAGGVTLMMSKLTSASFPLSIVMNGAFGITVGNDIERV